MATLNSSVMSLLDHAKGRDPNGKTATIVELLSQSNPILTDALWKECNDGTTELTSVRTGLPAVAWRLINNGVPTGKSTKAQIREATGMLESYSEVDVALAKINGDENDFRLSEASAFLEAMNQEAAQTLFYGNSGVAPEEFTGLSPRYSSTTAGNGANVLLGGGSGSDNCSVWLVGWGSQTTHMIYPKGSSAGLEHRNLGEVTIESANGIGSGTRMQAYRDHWKWCMGLALKDWRYSVRIANIDVSNLVSKTTAADLVELMIKATHRLPYQGVANPVFYMNRTCFEMLDIQRRDDIIAGAGLTWDTVDGKRQPSFRGIPIRVCDALLEAEALVS